jgi:2-hydroxychromene-2-carboxylate isomerase
MSAAKMVEYFYDLSSPYAYMAVDEVQLVAARCGATLVWRPFLLGGLFGELGIDGPPVLEASANKRAYDKRDMARWAELRRLPYSWPSLFPLNAVKPLRVLLQLEGADHARAARRLFIAYWGEGADISDPACLAKLLDGEGLEGAALVQGTTDTEVKKRLFTNTKEAFERGACGAPTFFVGDLMFWGQDRLDMVERALSGWRPRAG